MGPSPSTPPRRESMFALRALQPSIHMLRRLSAAASSTAHATTSVSYNYSGNSGNNSGNSGNYSGNNRVMLPSNRRRSMIRRERYMGDVERIHNLSMARNTHTFRLEAPNRCQQLQVQNEYSSISLVENPQSHTRWYCQYFLGNPHQNFAAIDPNSKSPFFLSILLDDENTPEEHDRRCILWTLNGPRRLSVAKHLSPKAIVQAFPDMLDFNRTLKEITNPRLQKDLALLEDQEGAINCKFGVIYAKAAQSSDVEMLANEQPSKQFEQLLSLLGQRIDLMDWGNYRGGLDTSKSVYTTFCQHEIMFHVSTLLPFTVDNPQQIERKRHIGNDIVNIVFEETDDPEHPTFSPSMIKSHFTHIFALVTHCEKSDAYRLWVYSEKSVPAYGPSLPNCEMFQKHDQFRQFLLTKVINGEKAALQACAFLDKRQKMNEALIKDMYMEYLKDCPRTSLRADIKHKLTDVVIRPFQREASSHDMAVQSADTTFQFCKYGELIKLEKQLAGDVAEYSNPRSKSILCEEDPWQCDVLYSEMPNHFVVASADSWARTSLLLCTQNGVVCMERNTCVVVIQCQVAQICVFDAFGLLIARFDNGKETGVCVFPLTDIRKAIHTGAPITREQCVAYRIEGSRGCTLLSHTDPHALRLTLAVLCGKTVNVIRWAFGPLGDIEEGTNLTLKFTLINQLTLNEEAMQIYVYDKQSSVCMAYTNKYGALSVIDVMNGSLRSVLPAVNNAKHKFRHIVAIADGNAEEVLYTCDNVTTTILSDSLQPPQSIYWTSILTGVVYRFPFIIGFSHDSIEVRLAVNGNLLTSMYHPNVRLLSDKYDIIFKTDETTTTTASAKEGTAPPTPNVMSRLRHKKSGNFNIVHPSSKTCNVHIIKSEHLDDDLPLNASKMSNARSPLRMRPSARSSVRSSVTSATATPTSQQKQQLLAQQLPMHHLHMPLGATNSTSAIERDDEVSMALRMATSVIDLRLCDSDTQL